MDFSEKMRPFLTYFTTNIGAWTRATGHKWMKNAFGRGICRIYDKYKLEAILQLLDNDMNRNGKLKRSKSVCLIDSNEQAAISFHQ